MGILEVSHLSMSFAEKQLYTDAEFSLNKEDHLGVIGQNGAGKSTLIKLITKQLFPDEGQIRWQKGIKIGYLDQYAESAHDLTIISFLKSALKTFMKLKTKFSKIMQSMLKQWMNGC